MKTDRIIRQSMMLMFTIMVFVVLPALAYDNATIKKAESDYQKGFAAFNMKRWPVAAKNFKESFSYIPHSMTAYMLSVTSLNMESPQQALTYAHKAINSKPGLEEPYVTAVREIADWAKKSRDDPYYKIMGKADEMNRPPSPQYMPPQPDIPENPKLAIMPSVHGNVITPIVPVKPIPVRDFTGKWRCNDGGLYFIRQTGAAFWWYGQSPDGGRSWSNVFHGRIHGNRITGQWADVPQGRTRNSGDMSLQIVGNNKLRAIRKNGGFGGNEWTR